MTYVTASLEILRSALARSSWCSTRTKANWTAPASPKYWAPKFATTAGPMRPGAILGGGGYAPEPQFVMSRRCRSVCSASDFHHTRAARVGTLPPPCAWVVAAGFDTAHAVVSVAITTTTVTVMILRISSSIPGLISLDFDSRMTGRLFDACSRSL